MSFRRIAVVTGANKGIGLAIVRNLALEYPKSALNDGPLLVYLTARNRERGEQAIQALQADEQLKRRSALQAQGGQTDVKYHSLDVSEKKSVDGFVEYLKTEHPEGVDFVINNAGIAMNGFDLNVVKETLAINYYGTVYATNQFLTIIRSGGRLVNVASMVGTLDKYSSTIRNRFLSAKSEDDIIQLMRDFEASVAAGKEKQDGWPSAAYAVSKAGLIGATKAIAERQKSKDKSVLINACCPGFVNTDMTKGRGHKTPDEGAKTPVLLALADIAGQTGFFWQSEKPIEW